MYCIIRQMFKISSGLRDTKLATLYFVAALHSILIASYVGKLAYMLIICYNFILRKFCNISDVSVTGIWSE